MPAATSTKHPSFLLVLLATFFFHDPVRAAATNPAATTPAAPIVLMKFPMDKGAGRGNGILIPVTIGQKEWVFLLDTGATRSVFDTKIEDLGPSVETEKALSASGHFQISLYHAPPIQIAGHSIFFDQSVYGDDLHALREVSGLPVMGVLGMDFLGRYVLRLDFQNREVVLLDPASVHLDDTHSFHLGKNLGSPVMLADFLGSPNTLVKLDTGCVWDGIVRSTFIETLGPPFTRVRADAVEATGIVEQKRYRIRAPWSLAGTHFSDMELSPGNENVIGLHVLADFVVTLDFTHERATFESIRKQHPAPLRDIGFDVLIRDAKRLVFAITNPTIAGDLRPGDQILFLDDQDVSFIPPWELHERIATQPKSSLRILRDNQTLDITLTADNK